MCFSATASFTAAAVLGAAGAVSLKKMTDRSQFMFAAIPLLFGIQQATEGLLWMSLTQSGYSHLQTVTTYFFLFFAQMLWTTWIPVSVMLLEKDPLRKTILSYISVAGVGASALLAYRMLFFSVHAVIDSHHINYVIGTSEFIKITSSVLYVIAIILPPFVSSVNRMKPLAIIQLASLLVTRFFYAQYLISVWCFFAGVLSIVIISIMQSYRNELVHFKPRFMPRVDFEPKKTSPQH